MVTLNTIVSNVETAQEEAYIKDLMVRAGVFAEFYKELKRMFAKHEKGFFMESPGVLRSRNGYGNFLHLAANLKMFYKDDKTGHLFTWNRVLEIFISDSYHYSFLRFHLPKENK